jgi:diguanylate cyclase (GGDEF)-like protein/PAS domain S-box-containing protein
LASFHRSPNCEADHLPSTPAQFLLDCITPAKQLTHKNNFGDETLPRNPASQRPGAGESRLRALLALLEACREPRRSATNERALLDAVTRTLVGKGSYPSASIGLNSSAKPAERQLASSCGLTPAPQSWDEAVRSSGQQCIDFPLQCVDQELGILRVCTLNTGFDEDEHHLLLLIAQDLAESLLVLRKTLAQHRLESNLRQLSRALESSCNGVMITSSTQLDHPIVYVNPAFEKISGYNADEVIGLSGRFLVRDDLNQKGLNNIRDALRNRNEGHAILRNYRKDGSLFWNELFISPVRDETGEATTHFVSIINDVTERIHYEQQLEYQANHDSLTGLANRNLLADRIAQSIAQAKAENLLVGVMLLDLDRFKLVNDGFGHSPANELLKAVSARLNACVRETDTVARLGGDEFVVVIGRLQSADDIAVVAGKILRSLAQPFVLEGKEIFITASIGAALYPRDGEHGEALLRNADVAMYRVKEHGRNNYRFYTPEMTHMALDRLDMEGNLRRGLERNELLVHYQPLVSLETGAIIGAEALARWSHPRIGMIHPGEFIPLAEESGLIIQLGHFVLEQVCRDIRRWQDDGLPPIQIAINLSARQFRQDDLAANVRRAIQESGIDGRLLDFELTESMVMHDVDNTLLTLRELKALGPSLSLDDFGTGYSSLSYLKRFPIDTLKIDRSFVSDIHQDGDDAAIAHAVIAMAHKLGLHVVAEGVETHEQLNLLREYECDRFQGYLFSRPVPVEEFTLMLRNGRTLASISDT